MDVIPFFVSQYGYDIFDAVLTFVYDGFHGTYTLLSERHHDFQGLEVFIHLAQPGSSFHFITHFHQRHKVPSASLVQRIGILSAFQEDSIHLVEVVLQTVVVFRKHTRA